MEARRGKQPPKRFRSSKAKPAPKTAEVAVGNRSKTSTNGTSETATSAPADVPGGHGDGGAERNYWLLKAEPESRYENDVDVKFSIDDLAARTEPEPWDGMFPWSM